MDNINVRVVFNNSTTDCGLLFAHGSFATDALRAFFAN